MKTNRHSYNRNYRLRSCLLIALALSAVPAPAPAASSNALPRTGSFLKDDFDKKLSEGRDLIDREEWAQAAKKFKDLIAKYPNNKSTDAALYWLAFCYKKQKQYAETEAVIARLMSEYPNSSWANDAQVMRLEIARPPAVYGVKTLPGTPGFAKLDGQFAKTYDAYPALSGFGKLGSQLPLEREDEIRLAAFQSLLAADLNRGLAALPPLFQNEKAGENLKINALRALRRPMLYNELSAPAAVFSIGGNIAAAPQAPPALNQVRSPAAIRQTLLGLYPAEKNVKLRREILGTLGSLGDAETLDSLAQLYASENDREIKKSILDSLGHTGGGFTAALKNLTPASQPAFSKLLEIMRTEKDPELKNLALDNLQRFPGIRKNEQFAQMLSETYDGEAGEELKLNIIETLGSTEVSLATRKLLEIARNEKTDKLRLEAIRQLGRSKDPEALKYLEDLIK